MGFVMGSNLASVTPNGSNQLRRTNHQLTNTHRLSMNTWLMRCLGAAWQARLTDFPPLPNLEVSSFGVIPKWGQVGKWRLIVDLSSPTGSSVNDGIDPEKFTLHYITVDQVIHLVSQFETGALMAKFDVEATYRNVPVHPSGRSWLGMKWHNRYYVDLTPPFGLLSAPFIFNAIADMVAWILVYPYQISALLHYLDDFPSAGPPDSPQHAHNLCTALTVCKRLGLPLHPGKCEGKATVFVILGIELDLVNQVAAWQ